MKLSWCGRRVRSAAALGAAALFFAIQTGGVSAQASAPGGGATLRPGAPRPVPTCERCHGELEFLRQHSSTLDRARSLSVSDRLLRGSGHDLPCADCHKGFGAFPHAVGTTTTATCASCHPAVAREWNAGTHAHVDQGSPVGCKDCHGVHPVPTRAGLKGREAIAAMNQRCLACHNTRAFPALAPHSDSVACASCHGAHDVRSHDQAGSTLAARSQITTCGACHREEAASWRNDIHGQTVLGARSVKTVAGQEPPRPPTCTTCHGGHQMVHPKQVAAGTGPGAGCTKCHEKYADTFGDSYHGQASRLGSKRAAGCTGCHTAHSILPAANPRSSVAKANLVATCGHCHPRATASFTAFQPHGDVHDRAKSPLLFWTYRFMMLLLTGTLMFFGVHTALWLVRSLRGEDTGSSTHARARGKGGDA